MRKPARLPLEALTPYLLSPSSPGCTGVGGGIIDWHAVFGNDNPVEIEVGFGKGLFLLTSAMAHPEINYLGIEALRGLQLYAATRLAKRKLTNVRVTCADARRFLHERVAPSSVQAIHVYFPDPWWKKRHHKRRVWTPMFATDCTRVLKSGGRLHIATDVKDYFTHVRELLDGKAGIGCSRAEDQSGPPLVEETLTNFERKAREKGESVYRAEYVRE